jgi:hypothetical protein
MSTTIAPIAATSASSCCGAPAGAATATDATARRPLLPAARHARRRLRRSGAAGGLGSSDGRSRGPVRCILHRGDRCSGSHRRRRRGGDARRARAAPLRRRRCGLARPWSGGGDHPRFHRRGGGRGTGGGVRADHHRRCLLPAVRVPSGDARCGAGTGPRFRRVLRRLPGERRRAAPGPHRRGQGGRGARHRSRQLRSRGPARGRGQRRDLRHHLLRQRRRRRRTRSPRSCTMRSPHRNCRRGRCWRRSGAATRRPWRS